VVSGDPSEVCKQESIGNQKKRVKTERGVKTGVYGHAVVGSPWPSTKGAMEAVRMTGLR